MKKETKKAQECDKETVKPVEETTEATPETTADASSTEAEAPSEEAEGVNMAEEVAKWQSNYARLSADFDNFRKRTLKEKMELIDSAGAEVLVSVLSILDDMDRAVEANKKAQDIEAVIVGMELIHKKLADMLRSKGVTEIEAMGAEPDTDLHDAIARFPVEEDSKKGKIIDVVEKGYKLKEKVIRFSKVVVGE